MQNNGLTVDVQAPGQGGVNSTGHEAKEVGEEFPPAGKGDGDNDQATSNLMGAHGEPHQAQ